MLVPAIALGYGVVVLFMMTGLLVIVFAHRIAGRLSMLNTDIARRVARLLKIDPELFIRRTRCPISRRVHIWWIRFVGGILLAEGTIGFIFLTLSVVNLTP